MYQCVAQFAGQKITAYWYGILRLTVEKVVSGMLLDTVIFKIYVNMNGSWPDWLQQKSHQHGFRL
jgi:hypothetical protein